MSEETRTSGAGARRAALREAPSRELPVTIPLPAGAAPPFDPARRLNQRAAAEGLELPLSKPLSRRAERVVIAIVATAVVAGTALAFSMERSDHTAVGWLVGGVGGAVVAALVWAHLSGGVDKNSRAPRPSAAAPVTATVAPAPDPSVVSATYRLASIRARLVAGLLDQALSLSPLLLVGLVRHLRLVPQPLIDTLFVLAVALFLLAAPLSLWLTDGRTPGGKLLGIRVMRTDGMRMTLRRALRRELGGAGRGGVLSLLSMNVDELRRSAADTRARTVVVVDDGDGGGPADADQPAAAGSGNATAPFGQR